MVPSDNLGLLLSVMQLSRHLSTIQNGYQLILAETSGFNYKQMDITLLCLVVLSIIQLLVIQLFWQHFLHKMLRYGDGATVDEAN